MNIFMNTQAARESDSTGVSSRSLCDHLSRQRFCFAVSCVYNGAIAGFFISRDCQRLKLRQNTTVPLHGAHDVTHAMAKKAVAVNVQCLQ